MKIFWKLLVALVVIAIIAVGAIVFFFDPNDYKPQIVEQINKRTGRIAVIDGKLGWDIYPRIAITAENFSLSNPDGFTDSQMLSVGSASFSAALMPLLKGAVEVNAIMLNDATISLEKLADGLDNWGDLASLDSSGTSTDQHDDKGPAVLIKHIEIGNSKITYRDAIAGQQSVISIRKLTSGNVGIKRPVNVEVDMSVDSSQVGQYDLVGSGTVTSNEDGTYIIIPDLAMAISPLGSTDQIVTINGDFGLDQNRQQFVLRRFSLTGPNGAEARGDLQAADYLDAPKIDGSLDISALPVASLARQYGIKLPFAPESKALESLSGVVTIKSQGNTVKLSPIEIKLDQTRLQGWAEFNLKDTRQLDFDLNIDTLNVDQYMPQAPVSGEATKSTPPVAEGSLAKALGINGKLKISTLRVAGQQINKVNVTVMKTGDTLKLHPLSLQMGGAAASGSFALERLFGDLAYTGDLSLAQFNPRHLLKSLGVKGLQFSDANAMTAANSAFSFRGTSDKVTIDPFQMNLDQSVIKGSFSISNFSAPYYGFNLDVNKINIDRYLPPSNAPDQRSSNEAETARTVSNLNLGGSVKIGNLHVSGLNLSNFSGTIKTNGSKMTLSPLSAGLYGGSYDGNIVVDGKGQKLTWSANEKVRNINLGPFLKDLVGNDRIDGKANLSMKINGYGSSQQQIFSSMNGNLAFDLTNGAVKGINLAKALRDAKAKLNGQSVPVSDGVEKTDFTELKGTATVNKGIFSNNDLEAKTPFMRITGNGTVDLGQGRANYLVTAKVVNTSKGQGGAEFKELEGYSIPIRVKGPFDDLSYSLDLEALLKERAEKELEEKKEEIKDELEDKLRGKLGLPPKKQSIDTKQQQVTEPEPQQSVEDQLKDKLKEKLFKNLKF